MGPIIYDVHKIIAFAPLLKITQPLLFHFLYNHENPKTLGGCHLRIPSPALCPSLTIIDIQLQLVRQTGVDHFRFCSLLVRSDAMTIAPPSVRSLTFPDT